MINLKNITKKYEDEVIFENFNLSIPQNKITCILGESGVGKTTLLNMIVRITEYQGEISLVDKIAYIFQEPRLIPSLTVEENLKFIAPLAKVEEIDALLSILEIKEKKKNYPRQLSGGEQQRVSIARAFLYDAPLILMDEPFSSLDLSLKYRLIRHFAILWKQTKKTVLFVTHTIDEALWLANEIVILSKGRIVKQYSLDTDIPRALTENEELRTEIVCEMMKDSL